MSNRTDIHRVSNIKPEEYVLWFCYALASTQDGWPVPSVNINCALHGQKTHSPNGQCCVIGMRLAGVKMAEHGSVGSCTVCGTAHLYGDVWLHEPSGEHIFVGHQCADKYELIADRRDFQKALGNVRVQSAREHEKAMREEDRNAYIDSVTGLREALETDHNIVRDIKDRFLNGRYTSLTEKQESLVLSIWERSKLPKVVETHVAAPVEAKRQTVEGEIVSIRFKDSYYGGSFKLTVKVHTPEGTWLAWGTCPKALIDSAPDGHTNKLHGATVRFVAKLKQGRDAHFALYSRPSKVELVSQVEAA
jgi:hypothetical protein